MKKTDNNVPDTTENKSSRHRSPAFPMISFEDALGRLKVIYAKDRRASINVDTLISHLGYKGTRAGVPGRVIAALKQYNLLEEKASQFKVSDTGFKIMELPENSQEREQLIGDSALAPSIFQRLLAYYDNELPSDENLASHLKINENFNPDSVNNFIKVFRANVNLVDSLSIKDNTENKDTFEESQDTKKEDVATPTTGENSATSNHLQTTQLQGESLKFRISRESDVIVTFSGKVTQEGIEKLIVLLDATKDTYPTNEELEKVSKLDFSTNFN